jgi:hypothetical protein
MGNGSFLWTASAEVHKSLRCHELKVRRTLNYRVVAGKPQNHLLPADPRNYEATATSLLAKLASY